MYEPLDPPAVPDDHYFTLAELRAEQDIPEDYDDAILERNRQLAEELLEHACGVAFIPRTRTDLVTQVTPLIGLTKPLVREIVSVEAADRAWTWDELQAGGVSIEPSRFMLGLTGPGRARITYTYGMERPPQRIRRAAMIATRVWTERGPVDDRAIQIAADGATINLATPGMRGSFTGIPEVDAAINDYRRPARLA